MSDLINLEPKAIWKNFSLLNAVPRPSKREEKVRAFIKKYGENLGLETTVDPIGNVIIRKPATPGMEDRKTVTLQSHLDMVHQKNADVDFDFETQGIKMYVDDDWVTAEGTTLGADNGIGVASIMSILESNEIAHPSLEALFTIDEEQGLTGASNLKPRTLKGQILLNLDTEEDDEIDIGCAGGVDVTASKTCQTIPLHTQGISIEIKGLQGGHSGMDIHLGRGNANVILRRLLFAGLENQIQLVSIDAGGLRNAIPREATALFAVADPQGYLVKAEALKASILEEYKHIERDLNIRINSSQLNGEALTVKDSIGFIRSLNAAHNGVYRMSPEVIGLVEASNNIARIELQNGHLKVMCLTRSSVDSTKKEVASQLKAAFSLSNMDVTLTADYPGWAPDSDSEIVKLLERIYRERFNEEPNVMACHAGLECGVIGATHPDMDLISFGPTIQGAHSPDERVNIKSVQKFWGFLLQILKETPKK